MIFELRTYTLQPGKTEDYWRSYEDGGWAAQDPRLNQIVHFWKFDDADQRKELRAANYARSDWDNHLKKIRPMMLEQKTELLLPSPVPGMCPLADR
jgi:hypothetical protein